jgi:hypothetical protein
MLVTLFLVLINIHNTIQTNSPKVQFSEFTKQKIRDAFSKKKTENFDKNTQMA